MDAWTFVLVLGTLHGLFVATMLAVPRPGRPRAHVYLALLVLSLSLHLGEMAAFRMGFTAADERRFFIFFTTPNTYLFGPLFYLFACTLLRGRMKRTWPHFIPAALAFVNYMPAYIGVLNGTIPVPKHQPSGPSMFIWIHPYWSWAFLIAHAGVYVAMSYRRLRAFSAGLRESVSRSNALDADWLWKLAAVMIASLTVQLLSLFAMLGFRRHSIQIEYIDWLSFALSVHFMGWVALRRTEVILVPVEAPEPAAETKYRRSGLDPGQAQTGRAKLLACMADEKPWLDPDLQLRDLAARIGLTPHHLSQLLNQEVGRPFFDFVNGYRVEEAKRRLADPGTGHLTHLAVALEAGFASKSSFHRVFKKHVGMTPSAYVQSLRAAEPTESRSTG